MVHTFLGRFFCAVSHVNFFFYTEMCHAVADPVFHTIPPKHLAAFRSQSIENVFRSNNFFAEFALLPYEMPAIPDDYLVHWLKVIFI